MVTWITIVKPVVWVMSFIPAYGFRGCGRCKIHHARFCDLYVVLPGNPYYRPGKSIRHGTYGSVDRDVLQTGQ